MYIFQSARVMHARGVGPFYMVVVLDGRRQLKLDSYAGCLPVQKDSLI